MGREKGSRARNQKYRAAKGGNRLISHKDKPQNVIYIYLFALAVAVSRRKYAERLHFGGVVYIMCGRLWWLLANGGINKMHATHEDYTIYMLGTIV